MSDELRITKVDYYTLDPKYRRPPENRYRVTFKLSRRLTKFERDLIQSHMTVHPGYIDIQSEMWDTLALDTPTLEAVEPLLPDIRSWLADIVLKAASDEEADAKAKVESAQKAAIERQEQNAIRDRINAKLNLE